MKQNETEWEALGIKRATFFKYRKAGMPKENEAAKQWIQERQALTTQGSGQIVIGGRTYTAQDLMDLRGKVMEEQAQNLKLKNRMEKLNIDEREGKLVDAEKLTETMARILVPLRKALDQMPENLATALNPEDPARAEEILGQELENIYADLTKNLSKNEPA